MGLPGNTAAGGDAHKAEIDREFALFYREHLRDVYNYTYYRTGNHHDAEELYSKTLILYYSHF
jgi:RNA polymerase sigma-70 factor (ECF subfamily)